jgi:anti-sigma B factor antagonist
MEETVYKAPERIDRNSSEDVQEEIWKLLDEGVTDLVIDMEELTYLSSAGLRVLIAAQKRLADSGSLVLKNVPDVAMDVLNITGLSKVITIE